MQTQEVQKCAWLSYEQFTQFMPMTRQSFNYMCREGHVQCRKFGRFWYVHRSELE